MERPAGGPFPIQFPYTEKEGSSFVQSTVLVSKNQRLVNKAKPCHSKGWRICGGDRKIAKDSQLNQQLGRVKHEDRASVDLSTPSSKLVTAIGVRVFLTSC